MDKGSRLFGEVISELRRKAGVSQEALAGMAGIHRTYISQLERGIKSPTLVVLTRIADALNTRPSRILAQWERAIYGV